MASRRFTVDSAKKKEFINIFLLMPESSVLNARRLRRCRDGVVALVVMASLPSPMCRRLSIVNDDGNSTKGNDDDDGMTGDDKNNNPDDAMDDEVKDNEGDGATDDDIDDNCNGATGDNNDNDDNDDHDDASSDDDDNDDATDDDVNDDGNSATGNEVDNDGNGTTDDDIINNCNGTMGGRHCLDGWGGCATKGDARWRHATTGNATTSR
jgi:hypothetical protein